MKIFPAIDIKDEKCVRLIKGDFENKTEYQTSPIDQAGKYKDHGFKNLHIVDLDGALTGKTVNLDIIKEIVSKYDLKIEIGGGVRSLDSIKQYIDVGVEKVILGSGAIKNKEFLKESCEKFKGQIALGLDAKDGNLSVSGWKENLNVKTIDFLKEVNDLIWLWHGEGEPSGLPPWFAEIDSERGMVYGQFTDTWPCHITRCVENQLDYAHLPFVHKSTIGRFVDVQKQAKVEMDDKHIRVMPNLDKQPPSFIEYRFPNIWQNYISENFLIFLAFVPVDEETTILYLRTYYRGMKIPILKDLVDWFFNITNSIILSQDRAVVVSQGSEPSVGVKSKSERLFLSDIPVRHFRKTWQENCREIEKD